MAEDQLLAHLAADLFHVKTAPLLLDDGVEHHLHQDVAQLFLHHDRIVSVDGFQRLARFFQKVFPDRSVGLDFVPRTAVLPISQDADDLHEVFRRIVFPRRPVLHGASPFRIPKTSANRFKLYRRICRNARVQAHFPAFCGKIFHFIHNKRRHPPGDTALRGLFSLQLCAALVAEQRVVRDGRAALGAGLGLVVLGLFLSGLCGCQPLPYPRKSSQ